MSCLLCVRVCVIVRYHVLGRISRKRLGTMEHLQEMAYGESNGHVIDDVT